MPSFTEWIIATSSEAILARPSRHSTTGTSASGTSGPRWFSLILPHERIRRRIWWWTFPTLIHIVAETAIVSCHTLPVGFPLPTISKNSLYTLFCPLILDHGVLLKISASGPKVLISNFLFDASFHHSFSICDNQVQLSSVESPDRTIQYDVELLRLSHSLSAQSFQDVIMRDFSSLRIEILNHHSKNNCKQVDIIPDGVIGPSDWKYSTRRSSNRSVFHEGNGLLFVLFCSSRLTFILRRVLWMILFSAATIFVLSTKNLAFEFLLKSTKIWDHPPIQTSPLLWSAAKLP